MKSGLDRSSGVVRDPIDKFTEWQGNASTWVQNVGALRLGKSPRPFRSWPSAAPCPCGAAVTVRCAKPPDIAGAHVTQTVVQPRPALPKLDGVGP